LPLRILIIDDHRDYRAWLGHHLGSAWPDALVVGHDPTDRGLLPEGFEPNGWDLVFVDHHLGQHDGLEALARLKAIPGCPPVVFLAPQGDQRAVVRALQAGADDFLSKGPSSHDHIVRVVRAALHGGRPGAPVQRPRVTDAPGFKLKGHRLLESLGRGSTASVYLMERVRDERLVVAKVFTQVPDLAGDVAPLQRFLREYEVIAGIDHPNVVKIFDLGIADDMAFIVMEYFPGGHLGEKLAIGLSPAEALDLLAQAAAALEAIHSVGILHRDLKPANIMLRGDGSLALIDFGVAKLRDASADVSVLGEIFGTPYYMSPEQGEGAAVDERADIYGLGVVFHEMLTGRKPFVAGSPVGVIWKHRHAPRPVLPMPLQHFQPLLERMMAPRPRDRFSSAGALREVLAGLRPEKRLMPAEAGL
jgi:eukaryotic-like serine/threonine-protein kinase